MVDRSRLRQAARAVLEANWVGRSTVPSASLYPHQWSWDSAFAAIGWSWIDEVRARTELETLFDAQWANGKLPHIVFNPDVPRDAYFPGPEFWRSGEVPAAPRHVETSGIVQPPIHARAAWEVIERSRDTAAARAFAERLYPRLVAWHAYLRRDRDPRGVGLAALLHPWESGLDNSPAWAAILDGLEIPDGALPAYERRDLVNADPDDRPTDAAYDRFVYLAAWYREQAYDDAMICTRSPFLIVGPLVNALLAWSEEALGEMAALLGGPRTPHETAAAEIRDAMRRVLWDPDHGRFYSRDLGADRLLREPTILGLLPLVDPGLAADHVAGIERDLRSPRFHPPEGREHYLVPSYDVEGMLFDPRRYWRGPVWVSTNWLLCAGLRRHGIHDLADEVGEDTLLLAEREGFHEYFDPFTGTGYGSDRFSWTAALVLDLIERGGA